MQLLVTNGDGLQMDLQSGNAAVLLTAQARQPLERATESCPCDIYFAYGDLF